MLTGHEPTLEVVVELLGFNGLLFLLLVRKGDEPFSWLLLLVVAQDTRPLTRRAEVLVGSLRRRWLAFHGRVRLRHLIQSIKRRVVLPHLRFTHCSIWLQFEVLYSALSLQCLLPQGFVLLLHILIIRLVAARAQDLLQ